MLSQNSYIHNLPYEVLREILTYLPLFTREDVEGCNPAKVPKGVVTYQVCKLWRTIVRNIPELWSVIPLHNRRWAVRALRYSAPASISIIVDLAQLCDSTRYRDTVARALRFVSRARELSFSWLQGHPRLRLAVVSDEHLKHLHEILGSLECVEAPFLESFTFADFPAHLQHLPMQHITNDLFCGAPLPRLRHLSLAHVKLCETSSLFHAPLITLNLDTCSLIAEEEILNIAEDEPIVQTTRIERLLGVLRRLPMLELFVLREMEFENADPDGPFDSDMYALHGIALPKLDMAVLSGGYRDIGMLLRYLSLSVDVDLSIKCYVDSDWSPFLPDMCPTLVRMFHDGLHNALNAGLAFQDIHVSFRYKELEGVDVLRIVTSNPRPFARRVQGHCGRDGIPATRVSLTMTHRQQVWLADNIMGLHAGVLLAGIPALSEFKILTNKGWDIPAGLEDHMRRRRA
ncbi:hypothetical protein BV25DRAFT_930546 [Artomyces pyxidatus]|uniref:Uncharacterized protein n=1 Tax=Artomyces pyxidatus TaxID=48021 RepID=A0ACB8SWX1_9AGAM|nr:hypothetical protein BV25DRAFT_930546 [Artomyces pyxidatus]